MTARTGWRRWFPGSPGTGLRAAEGMADLALRRQFAQVAESAGCFEIALEEYEYLARLDGDLATELGPRIRALRMVVAAGILRGARRLLGRGLRAAAADALFGLVARFPETPAANEAVRLLRGSSGAAAEV